MGQGIHQNNTPRYNAFYYRLSRSGPEQQQAWKEIQKDGRGSDAKAFINDISDGNMAVVRL